MNYTPPAPKKRRSGLPFALGYLIVIWAVFILNNALGGALYVFGLQPLDPGSLWHMFTSPLLHGGLDHIISNSLPGAIFCYLIGFSGKRVFWEVTLISAIVGGLGTWFFGGAGTNHIGASGLVYGWLAYLIIRGIFNRHMGQVIMGIILAFCYAGLIWGVFPGQTGVSWQGHLFGALGGLGAGMFITSDDPPALKARRQQKKLEGNTWT